MSTRNAGNGKHGKSGVKNTAGAGSTGNTRGSGSMGSSRSTRSAGDSRNMRSAGDSRSARSTGDSRSARSTGGSRSASSGRVRSEGDVRGRSSAAAGRKRSAGSAREREYEEIRKPSGKKPVSKKKKAAKRRRRAILFGVEILILVVMLGFLYTVLKTEKVERIKIDEEKVVMEMNENVETNEVMKGYRNIALFGVDSREGSLGKGTRSDTIIIASINQDTGEVKLVSVFRDTYLNLGNDSYNKCNAAYAKGGPEQAITMLNKNLDMNITDYITVGFDGLIEVIDALGGVEINVTQAEIKHLNNYQISMVGTSPDGGVTFVATEGKDYTAVKEPGLQVLNGLQATAYCRIRYIGNDFQRAQRQRDVIAAIAEKAKTADVSKLNDIANGMMGNISTSLDIGEILDVMKDLGKYRIVANDGFPFEQYRTTGTVGGKGSCVIPQDLAVNVVELHKFLFNEENYQISSEVEEFSKKVASDTGKYANTATDEFTQKENDDEVAASE